MNSPWVASGESAAQKQSESVLQLIGLGLTSYEAKAYLALVGRDSSTAAQVARLARLPRQRIYDVLDGLVEKGLASIRPAPVSRYAATAPDRALEWLLARRREQLAAAERAAAMLVRVLRPAFDAGQQQRDELAYVELLHSSAAAIERLAELGAAAQRELLVFAKVPAMQKLTTSFVPCTSESCHARSVYELSSLDDDECGRGLALGAREDALTRFVPELPHTLVIVDDRVVAFSLQDPVAGRSELTTIVISHSALAETCKLAFDSVWQQALTLEQAQAASRSSGSPRDRALLIGRDVDTAIASSDDRGASGEINVRAKGANHAQANHPRVQA